MTMPGGPPHEPSWRSGPAPFRWRVYATVLGVASVPFCIYGLVSLASSPVSMGLLVALFLIFFPAGPCILELPPYRFLHLAVGFFVFGGLFIAGPGIIGLLALSVLVMEGLRRRLEHRIDFPIGFAPAEYAVPAAAVVIALGSVDTLYAGVGLAYPFRPAGARSEALFLILLSFGYATFVVLSEAGVALRFGWRRAYGSARARLDLLVYIVATLLGGPVVVAAVHVYAAGFPPVAFAAGWALWGFGLFVVTSLLIRRGLRIESLIADVRRNERLAALGRLASIIAHQTRHHLGVLNMSAYVLRERLAEEPLSDAGRAAVDRELEAIGRTREELDRLLAQELRGNSREEHFEILALARECGADLAAVADARSVSVRCNGEELHMRGDRLRLKQAITNVVRNAIEASPEGTNVTIDLVANGSDSRLEVRDRGPGLSAEARAHLFEPLFTEKSDGLGMGLYVAREIVEAHGGGITIADTANGAVATIHFDREPSA